MATPVLYRELVRQDEPFWPCLTRAGVHKAVGRDLNDIERGLIWIENALISTEYPTIDDLGNGNAVSLILHNIVRLTPTRPESLRQS